MLMQENEFRPIVGSAGGLYSGCDGGTAGRAGGQVAGAPRKNRQLILPHTQDDTLQTFTP